MVTLGYRGVGSADSDIELASSASDLQFHDVGSASWCASFQVKALFDPQTVGDDSDMDIYFLLERVTVRSSTYTRTDAGEN